MTTPQPQGLPPQTFAEWLAQPVDWDVMGNPITRSMTLHGAYMSAAEYGWNAATEALRAQAATLESIHQIIQCAGPDAAGEIADLLGYPSVEWPSAQAASVEPVAYMTEDGRVSMRTTVETAMPRVARESFTIPLYAGAPPSQASVPNDGWLIDRGLLYRLTDGPNPQNRDEISITMADGSRSDASRNRRSRELLDCIRSTGPASVPGEVEKLRKALSEVLAFKSAPTTPTIHDYGRWRRAYEASPLRQHPSPSPAQADAASEAFTGIANDDDFWTALDAWRENLQAYQPQVQQGGGESTATKLAKRTCEANADAARFTIALQTLRASLDPDDWMGPVTMHAYIDKVLAGGSPLNPDCTLTTKDPK